MLIRNAVVTTQDQIFPSSVVPGGWRWNVAMDGAGAGTTFDGVSLVQEITFPSAGGYTISVSRIASGGNVLGPTVNTRFTAADTGQVIAVALSVAIQP